MVSEDGKGGSGNYNSTLQSQVGPLAHILGLAIKQAMLTKYNRQRTAYPTSIKQMASLRPILCVYTLLVPDL
jgi:hypothetical protein